MDEQRQQWARVGQELESRMADISMSQADLARATKISRETLRHLIAGKAANYRGKTLRATSRAVGWTPESIDLIRQGERPRLAETVIEARLASLEHFRDQVIAVLGPQFDALTNTAKILPFPTSKSTDQPEHDQRGQELRAAEHEHDPHEPGVDDAGSGGDRWPDDDDFPAEP